MTFRDRWRALRHRRLQGALAVAAMATAVALPVVLLSVGGGVADHEIYELEHSGYQVAVSGPGLHGIQGAHALAQQIDGLDDVASASPVLSSALDAFLPGGGPTPVLAEGVIPAAFVQTESPEEIGLFPKVLPFTDPSDSVHYANGSYSGTPDLQVMVSSPFAQEYGLAAGSSLLLAPSTNASEGVPFAIAGTFGVPRSALGPTAAFALLLPLSDLQVLTGYARGPGSGGPLLDAADTVQVALAPAATTDVATIDRVAGEVQGLVPYDGVSALTDQATQIQSSTAILFGFYLALSSVGLAVGFVFLALVLLRRVESERSVIAVQRAIGVPARQIAGTWVRAGAILGASGVAGGLVGGIVLVTVLADFASGAAATAAQLAVFDPVTLGAVGAGVVGLSVLASAAATRAALRLPIAGALR